MATIEEMLLKAAEVRNERGAGQNTAVRIGDVLLCAAALIQALQEGLDAETAARSGGDSGLSGQIAAEAAARQGAVQELINRLLGTSDASSAYTDPLVLLGNFDDYADFNAALDAIGSSTDDGVERKHVGLCRAIVQGTPFFVFTSVLSWQERKYAQIILGCVQAASGGGSVTRSESPGIFGRSRSGDAWGAWTSIGGGDMSAYLKKSEALNTHVLKTVYNTFVSHFEQGSGANGAVVFGDNFGIGSSARPTKFFGNVSFGAGVANAFIEFLYKAFVTFYGRLVVAGESYEMKDGTAYPLSHPDLNTQGSILPQRFGNLKIYERLIYLGYFNPCSVLYIGDLPSDAKPIMASVFGRGSYDIGASLVGGVQLYYDNRPGYNCWECRLAGVDVETAPYYDVYLLVQYYLPEGGGYYY